MLTFLAGAITRRPKTILAALLITFACFVIFGLQAFGALISGGFDDPNSEASRQQRVVEANFDGRVNVVVLVTASEGSTVDSIEAQRVGKRATTG